MRISGDRKDNSHILLFQVYQVYQVCQSACKPAVFFSNRMLSVSSVSVFQVFQCFKCFSVSVFQVFQCFSVSSVSVFQCFKCFSVSVFQVFQCFSVSVFQVFQVFQCFKCFKCFSRGCELFHSWFLVEKELESLPIILGKLSPGTAIWSDSVLLSSLCARIASK